MTIAAAAPQPVPDKWVDAVAQIETGGQADPDNAIGDGGKAKGRYQFHKSAWDDCTKARKSLLLPTWGYSKATDPNVAREYAAFWLACLRDRLSKDIGRPAMAHEVWLAYNMGYAGFKRASFQATLVPQDRWLKARRLYDIACR